MKAIDSALFSAKNRKMFSLFPGKTARRIECVLFALALTFAIPARAAQLPRCCVWRVTNAKAPFYLVGSIHTLTKKDYPLPIPYEIAFKDSRRLLFEFDPTRHAEFEKKFAAAAKYPRGQDIRSKIDPQLLAWLRQNVVAVDVDPRRGNRSEASGFNSGLDYKPWWIAQHLVNKNSNTKVSTAHGLDNYFVDRGEQTGKEIGGLESVDEHVAVLGGLSDREGEIMLRNALAQPKGSAAEFNRMLKAWRKGDTDTLWVGDAQFRKDAPSIAARFVEGRNVKWVPRIVAELESGKPTAVVAGALHFAGPNSVIKLLEKRGYKIQQL
ncbi:MAG: hypothetical protein DME50_11080 [Verrucomicrobia bacterium]|nr:MAG: hypothetical protein DME85_05255 [Verrucomicrobiota bacterium]PYK64860.1 MAG: hypothetical protein DME50_11080 [Verrucomicrobiota bacterium]